MSSETFEINPITKERTSAMRWFSSLAQQLDKSPSLEHAVEFYNLFTMTGNHEYLQKSEDFLMYSIEGV